MVSRRFVVRHAGEQFPLDYDTNDGLEVLKFQIFSLTSVLPDDQKIVVEEGDVVLTEASDLESVPDKLRLVSRQEEAGGSKSVEMSDEELARMLQEEEDRHALQMFQAQADGIEFEHRIRHYVSQVLKYEDPRQQKAAHETVPVDELEEKALVWLAKEGTFDPSVDEKNHAFLLQLLFWFKQSFSWVNAPSCDSCGSETKYFSMGVPLPSEMQYGGSRVELYRCTKGCSSTRFPRYNDPLKLLETRKGRCGEWANCFTLYCRAFGYESRLVLDFTDHLWTECFSHLHGRWMHLDPCEGVYDNPLLYEKGWNKKLTYIIGISKDGICDCTKRYTKKWHEVLNRRNVITEPAAAAVLSNLTRECRNGYSPELLTKLQNRDKNETDELENAHLHKDVSPSLPGRQSGSMEWRVERLEIGSGINRSLGNSCPLRTCVDDHVSNIYSSFSHLLSLFVDSKLLKPEVAENLEVLKKLFVNLKSCSFKVRRAFVSPAGSHLFNEEKFPPIFEVLSAASLKRERPDSGEQICISLAGNPVQTSIILPIALVTLDEIINHLHRTTHFDQRFLINFSRLNRISSGSVLASGEQLPSGTATAAFDGSHLSKWEEPNGAKGCWLIYKVKNAQLHALEAYELMSANDVPERDPMDWILEGSEDEGSSWNVLDQRTSQKFEERFQRKRFKVNSMRKSNVFRFNFRRVRDSEAQPRFQIGSIDLYAVGS